jgi:hypothetical protein
MPMIHSAPAISAGPSRAISGVGVTPGASRVTSGTLLPSQNTTAFTARHLSTTGNTALTGRQLPLNGGNAIEGSPHREPNHLVTPSTTAAGDRLNGPLPPGSLTAQHDLGMRSVNGAGSASALRNGTFASLAGRSSATRALASASFQGHFASLSGKFTHAWFWRHRHPFVAFGWYGPLFWPYAYPDFIDYTFWPYAYDVFWPYAYDDIYVGVFGPYSYEGPAYSGPTAEPRGKAHASAKRIPAETAAEVCRRQVPELAAWPIQQIAQAVGPDQTQQVALDALKDATGRALDVLQSACPNDLPSTPPGRLAAMRQRIETMAEALAIVKPALDHFYDLLSDEQKARFNPIAPKVANPSAARATTPDLAQVCSGQAAKPINAPIERIAQVLRPTDAQHTALQELETATAQAAEHLKTNCSTEEALTPPGRLSAMQQRLDAMLEAIKIVQPALEGFYGSLTDEQKARFNQLGTPQG